MTHIIVPPFLTFPVSMARDVTSVATLVMSGKIGGKLSLDYSSIFQSKFMVSEETILIVCSKSASTSLHDVIIMTHQYDSYCISSQYPCQYDLKPDIFCFFTSCLAYKPLYYVIKCVNNYVIIAIHM